MDPAPAQDAVEMGRQGSSVFTLCPPPVASRSRSLASRDAFAAAATKNRAFPKPTYRTRVLTMAPPPRGLTSPP
uniref:Uncharacterized protein n=1 Tax=Oryza meridionalis TaxID=40149 RepID=A0A0E0E5S2_9ORYZ